ncbi:hypothetical protein GX48_06766 [Paracoccidioides brasiliensis]|nr:hypothetical protein GX48_06766 [Paracoccidioides brasiliensis]
MNHPRQQQRGRWEEVFQKGKRENGESIKREIIPDRHLHFREIALGRVSHWIRDSTVRHAKG